jgi:hypothetical protein
MKHEGDSMLKTNTLLNFVSVILMGLLTWLGHNIWDDVAAIKASNISATAEIQSISHTIDDHEVRIRQTEHDVTILQSQQREERRALSPKMSNP